MPKITENYFLERLLCFIYLKMLNYVSLCGYAQVSVMPTVAEDGDRSSEARIIGSEELPDLGAGNRTQVLWKNNRHS